MKKSFLLFPLLISFIAHAQTTEFSNPPGWSWLFPPIRLPNNTVSIAGIILSCHELKNGDLLMNVAYAVKAEHRFYSLNAVAFDNNHKRFDLIMHGGGGSDNVSMNSYILPSAILPQTEVKYIGLEVLTYDSLKSRVSPSAFSKLNSFGISALPYPEINKPYSFDLLTIEGKRISSKSLLGNVILLDFWASWCSPCMAKMGDLKELYQRHKQNGFEIIGINFDFSIETAKKFIQRDNLSWPNVFVPAEKELRELWYWSSGVTALPRLFIIDRKGILRADIQLHDLEKEIEKYIRE